VYDDDPLPIDGLDLHLTALSPPTGRVQVLAFDRERGFPHDRLQALRVVEADVLSGELRLRIQGLQTDALAIVAVHDPDGAGFDSEDWLGRPHGGQAAAGCGPRDLDDLGFDETRERFDLGGAPVAMVFRYARGAAGTSTLDLPGWLVRAWDLVFGSA
jgi:hypothetical protein